MPRLGEILVHLELITDEHLHEALQTQVLYGGRLGTNLIELGYLTLDQLAKALARRHRLPAALGAHFDRCDPALQARVPVEIASKWRAVPIGRLAQDQRRLAIAVRDPLPEHARGELAFQLDVDAEELVQAIAPELRIHYHLEVAYQIPRSNRFLRVKSRVPTEIPVPPENVEDTNLEGWQFKPGEGTGARPAGTLVRKTERMPHLDPGIPPLRPAPEKAPGIPASESDSALKLDSQVGLKPVVRDETPSSPGRSAVSAASAEDHDSSIPIERRHFVPTLGDTSTQSTLARIAVRQVASDSAIRPIIEVAPLRPQGPEELARAVRRAETRDRVGDLIVEALGELPGAPLDAAAIFIIRPPLAIGWKGFCEDGNAVIESLAVPLDQPGLLAAAYTSQQATVCSPTAATVIDERMWSLFGGRPPHHVIVAPICVGDQCVCILYAHSRAGLGPAEALAITLADAAATAFGRLLRAAQR